VNPCHLSPKPDIIHLSLQQFKRTHPHPHPYPHTNTVTYLVQLVSVGQVLATHTNPRYSGKCKYDSVLLVSDDQILVLLTVSVDQILARTHTLQNLSRLARVIDFTQRLQVRSDHARAVTMDPRGFAKN
jgi:hypothetical protein